jgi:hypothetical protein
VQARGQSFEAGAIPGYVRTGLIVRNEHRLWQCRTDGREIRRIQETGERRQETGERRKSGVYPSNWTVDLREMPWPGALE